MAALHVEPEPEREPEPEPVHNAGGTGGVRAVVLYDYEVSRYPKNITKSNDY